MDLREFVGSLRGFTLSILTDRILLRHDGCAWYYTHSDRRIENRPPVNLASLIETAVIHQGEHHADGVWCINAICSVHFGGRANLHEPSDG